MASGIKLNGSTGYLELSSALIGTGNMTMIAFVSLDSGGGGQAWVEQGSSTADKYVMMWLDANGNSKYASIRNPGNGSNATKSSAPNPDATYKLAAATFTGGTSRAVAFGDSTFVTDTSTFTDDKATHDRVTIGALHINGGSPTLFMNGSVTEVHFYNTILTGTDLDNIRSNTIKPELVTGWVDGFILANATSLTSIGGTRTLTAVGGVSNSTLNAPITRTAPVAVTFSGTVPTQTGTVGTAVNFTYSSYFSGNQTPFAYTSVGTALPAGLTLSPSTGAITGTPTTAATTTGIIIRATDSASNVANTNSHSITISATTPTSTVTIATTLVHAVGGLPLVSTAGTIYFYDLSGGTLLATKTGLTTTSTGTLTAFTVTGLTAGTQVLWRWVSTADPTDTGFDLTTPA